MTKYIKDKQYGFIADGKDAANHPFSAFEINDEIHIVYFMGTPEEYAVKESILKINNNLDEYLWTPFARFV